MNLNPKGGCWECLCLNFLAAIGTAIVAVHWLKTLSMVDPLEAKVIQVVSELQIGTQHH